MISLPVRGRDAAAHLARALLRSASAAGLSVALDTLRAHPWASATFVGNRLSVVLVTPRAPALGRWLADLPLAELALPGHLVASLAVDTIEDDGVTVRAALTVLVIDQE